MRKAYPFHIGRGQKARVFRTLALSSVVLKNPLGHLLLPSHALVVAHRHHDLALDDGGGLELTFGGMLCRDVRLGGGVRREERGKREEAEKGENAAPSFHGCRKLYRRQRRFRAQSRKLPCLTPTCIAVQLPIRRRPAEVDSELRISGVPSKSWAAPDPSFLPTLVRIWPRAT